MTQCGAEAQESRKVSGAGLSQVMCCHGEESAELDNLDLNLGFPTHWEEGYRASVSFLLSRAFGML